MTTTAPEWQQPNWTQTLRFHAIFFSPQERFGLGVDLETGGFFVDIPVSNRRVDYLEYYAISAEEFARFHADFAVAKAFAERCKARAEDHRLIMKPGTDRGTAS